MEITGQNIMACPRGDAGNFWLGVHGQGSGGPKSPSGVQGRSPGKGPWGTTSPEAEALFEK